ncbi:hypothetical protein [Photobacterium profundum]|uniref:Uncharacterized protein n=1 Tax=Photobacterium profundum (strain SS9) TaxID=298386 RepID=Q6LHH0_PHOPR|nr:hypothetical protein [Photobacterium profundum]CAG23260.1 hypothetical protein PBPRB1393 [Photobacterium profundum SS9]
MTEALLSGFLGTLVGLLIGNRFALGRDKRKEYNIVMPVRTKLIKGLVDLESGYYSNPLSTNDLIMLKANLSTRQIKPIEKLFIIHQDTARSAGKSDVFGNYLFIGDGLQNLTVASKNLLAVVLRLK